MVRGRFGRRARVEEPARGRGAVRILVYSSDRTVRAAVIDAVGEGGVGEVPPLEYCEAATAAAVLRHMEAGRIDAAVLDGEAAPTGGLGLARQLRDEITDCPPIMVLLGRRADAWLAEWSHADAAVVHPLDPFEVAEAVLRLIGSAAGTAR